MTFPRSSGVLLHPTSLPGRFGIGDLGDHAYRFVDALQAAGQSYWQILPLGPTSYGDSPYQSLSTFAGNPNLISFDRLLQIGWLHPDDLRDMPDFPADRVDYGPVITFHDRLLDVAYSRFLASANDGYRDAFAAWTASHAQWLDDFALFVALKNHFGGRPWTEWDTPYALRETRALETAWEQFAGEIEAVKFRQWLFFAQWEELKRYANAHGVKIIGDIPIFVAHDSADVWANRDLFYLDARGNPEVVAGVPPDYFSATGQRWGNPLYKWDVHKARGYRWWIDRVSAVLDMVDLVRIDHFRAFEDYWEIPATEATAVKGRWLKGPNTDLFDAIRAELGDQLPIIAEDLGQITKAVEDLRDELGLPGMKIIQFAFSDPNNVFLPHNYPKHGNVIVYSGTHDNDTSLGWFSTAPEAERTFMRDYLARYDIRCLSEYEVAGALIELAFKSPANLAVAPLQDVLGLGPEARMNYPGRLGGNWSWRYGEEALEPGLAAGLRALAEANRRA